jgi:hypothetical protein
VAKLVARLLATAALWVRIQTFLRIQNGPHNQSSGQHTSLPTKYTKKHLFKENITGFYRLNDNLSFALIQTTLRNAH